MALLLFYFPILISQPQDSISADEYWLLFKKYVEIANFDRAHTTSIIVDQKTNKINTDMFEIGGVPIGADINSAFSNFGSIIDQRKEQTEFVNGWHDDFVFDGVVVHSTNGTIGNIFCTTSRYQTSQGLYVGMSIIQIANFFGINLKDNVNGIFSIGTPSGSIYFFYEFGKVKYIHIASGLG